jgi:hypothetical protein
LGGWRIFCPVPGSDDKDVLAAPRGIRLVSLKILAGASQAFAFLPDQINLRRVVEGIHPEPFLGFRGDKGSIFGTFCSVFELGLGHGDLLFSCKGAASARENEPSFSA